MHDICLHLISFSMIMPKTTPVATNSIVSFLWLSDTPLYMYTTSLSIHLVGRLGCFHVLAIVSSTAVNTGVHVCLWIMVFYGYMPRSGIAGSYGSSIFSSSRHLLTVFIVTSAIYIPTNSVEAFPFLHTFSPAFIVCSFFDDVRSDWCEVIPHCSFDWCFPDSDVKHLFMCFMDICMFFLGELFRSSAHFLIELFVFFDIELYELIVYFGG